MKTDVELTVRQLNYVYAAGSPFEKRALRDVSLTVGEREFIGLIGHTGSGKSTLIQCFNGLIRPTSGEVLLDGKNIFDRDVDRRRLRQEIGLVFQYPEHQLFEETVERDVSFGPRNLGLSEAETRERVIESLACVGLDESYLDRSPFDLSGGQKRRVAIAGVLAMRPRMLILDEPTAGLDPAGRDEILAQLHALYDSGQMTVILVSHSMEDVARFATRVVVMNRGELAMDGTVAQVFSRADELQRVGLDVPQITRLAAELRRRGVDIGADVYTVERAYEAVRRLFDEAAKHR